MARYDCFGLVSITCLTSVSNDASTNAISYLNSNTTPRHGATNIRVARRSWRTTPSK